MTMKSYGFDLFDLCLRSPSVFPFSYFRATPPKPSLNWISLVSFSLSLINFLRLLIAESEKSEKFFAFVLQRHVFRLLMKKKLMWPRHIINKSIAEAGELYINTTMAGKLSERRCNI